MKNKPLVSIIVGFLNAEKFIQEAIESVFAQTYDGWELLLIDDGSTDSSTAIARRYAEQYPQKVRYFEHECHQNRGVCASRNLGIHNSKGEYIAILDADDVWLPHKLELQVSILDSHPEVGMVYGSTQYWSSWTGKPEDSAKDFVPPHAVQQDTVFNAPTLLTLCYPLGKATAPCPSDLLLRRELVEEIGGFEETFPRLYQLYEDQAFLTKVYLHASVFVSAQCLDRYRLHEDSCMAKSAKAGQYHSVRMFFLNWLEKYLYDHNVEDPEVWKGLRRALWPYRHPVLHRLNMRVLGLIDEIGRMSKSIARRTLPAPIHGWLRAHWQGEEYSPPTGWVRFGSLRRVRPISRRFGFGRGLPVDRYYIERFLSACASDIQGRVLEIGDDTYTRRFGGDRIAISDVLDVTEGKPDATIVGDLTSADHIPSDAFNCVILTQTLQFVYGVQAALKTINRILKPGGVLLATFPGISQISRYDMDRWGQYWSFTTKSAQLLFEEVFPPTGVKIEAYGNVLAAIALLHGLATEELTQEELDHRDQAYEVLITVRAVKNEAS